MNIWPVRVLPGGPDLPFSGPNAPPCSARDVSRGATDVRYHPDDVGRHGVGAVGPTDSDDRVVRGRGTGGTRPATGPGSSSARRGPDPGAARLGAPNVGAGRGHRGTCRRTARRRHREAGQPARVGLPHRHGTHTDRRTPRRVGVARGRHRARYRRRGERGRAVDHRPPGGRGRYRFRTHRGIRAGAAAAPGP